MDYRVVQLVFHNQHLKIVEKELKIISSSCKCICSSLLEACFVWASIGYLCVSKSIDLTSIEMCFLK